MHALEMVVHVTIFNVKAGNDGEYWWKIVHISSWCDVHQGCY